MAQGRRLTSSRSDLLLGTGNYNTYYDLGHDQGHNYGYPVNITEEAEFGESDVWWMVGNTTTNYDHHYHHRESRATVEDRKKHVGGLSLAFQDNKTSSRRILHQYGVAAWNKRVVGPGNKQLSTSAPINVPDWSKILRVDSVESMHDSDDDSRVGDDDSVMEPPHEYLARSRQKNAFSVFEGVGRTLKGRDLSRVRDAVWSKTGFEG